MDSNDARELRKRWEDQKTGQAARKWSKGRIGPHDEGDLAAAIAVDPVHRRIVIEFHKPVSWLALDLDGAKQLIATLSAKCLVLEQLPAGQ